MSEPFIGEIRLFGGNFAPRGWSFCDGQLVAIQSNPALFSLLGTSYGGDGRSTFGLPNLQGRAPMGTGRGPGLSDRRLGEQTGATTETLTEQQLPSHNHPMQGSSTVATEDGQTFPTGHVLGTDEEEEAQVLYTSGARQNFATTAISSFGGGQAHDNVQPHIALNYIIALEGLFPERG